MKKILVLIGLFLLLLAGLALGPKIAEYQGYVLVVMENGTLQMSVFGLLFALTFGVIGIWLLAWVIRKVLGMLSGSHNWFGSWSERKNQRAFEKGLFALAEGNYPQAQEQLAKIEQHDFNGLNLLAAAEVALNMQQPDKARYYWRLAKSHPKAVLAANLCLIKDALQHEQPAAALGMIKELDQKQQTNSSVIKLWASSLAQAGKWSELHEKLKHWKKALGKDYDSWVQKASQGTFAEIASKQGANQLKQAWLNSPRAVRKDPAQQSAYVQQLIDQGMFIDAEKVLVEYQKTTPHPMLLPLFKQLKLVNPTASIKKLEGWLKVDDMNVDLLSALGHLAYYSKDFVLAEKALGKAIKLGNRQQDILLMANIREAQQDNNQALELYKQSLTVS